MSVQTICWDCRKATGGCSWSDHWQHKPVDGWVATATKLRNNNDGYVGSYIVHSCPQFELDGGVVNGQEKTG